MRPATWTGWLVVLAFVGFPGSTQAAPPTADAMALLMLDSEALYTLTGGLKPVSEGFWQASFPENQDTSPEMDAARVVLDTLPLGAEPDRVLEDLRRVAAAADAREAGAVTA